MFIRIIVSLTIILLSGCATERLLLSEQEINKAAQSGHQSTESLLNEYENKLKLLGEDTLTLYAPLNIKEANNFYFDAKQALKNQNTKQASNSLNKALIFLDKAHQQKSAVKMHLKNVDEHYLELIALEADKRLPNRFSKIQGNFIDLIKQLEKGEVQKAIKNQTLLIEQMIALEIDTINDKYLGKSEKMIQELGKLDIERYAPSLFQDTLGEIESTKLFIKKSYRNKSEILDRSEQILEQANTLAFIVNGAYNYSNADPAIIEAMSLKHYHFLKELSAMLNIVDTTELLAQKSLETFYTEVREKLTSQQSEFDTLKKELVALEQNSKPKTSKHSTTIESESLSLQSQISHETNKAVLSELMMPKPNDEISNKVEFLEFEDVQVLK